MSRHITGSDTIERRYSEGESDKYPPAGSKGLDPPFHEAKAHSHTRASVVMRPIQNILFPVDFSASCMAMAPFVRRAASITRAKVTLLHVLPPFTGSFELLARPLPEIQENREYLGRERLEAFLQGEFPGAESPRTLVAGDEAAEIANMAREGGFDLVIMPTHAGVFRRRLLGSTTAKVLDMAECPVLTTRHAERIEPRELGHREWVCAVGLHADSGRILRYASAVAESFHANLSLVHAISGGEPVPSIKLKLDGSVQTAEEKEARSRVEELQKAFAPQSRIHIAVGPIKDALTETAARLRADMLIIGRSPQPDYLGRLRDLTYAVIRDAPCPVLSV
jgi:nucleotide-binding universal stress UspA family protein